MARGCGDGRAESLVCLAGACRGQPAKVLCGYGAVRRSDCRMHRDDRGRDGPQADTGSGVPHPCPRLVEIRDLDHAIADYTEVIQRSPEDRYGYIARGATYYAKQDFETRLSTIRRRSG